MATIALLMMLNDQYHIREHQFNLKGYGFFRSQNIFFRLAAQQKKKFATSCRDIIFFSTKTIFFKAHSANRIFVSAHFTDRKLFSIKFADRHFFLTKKTYFPSS